MQLVVTVESDDPVIDEIFTYCQVKGIAMYPGRMIVIDHVYWYWRISVEQSAELSWILLRFGRYVVAHSGA